MELIKRESIRGTIEIMKIGEKLLRPRSQERYIRHCAWMVKKITGNVYTVNIASDSVIITRVA